jgi:hypothetical protein
MVKGKDPRQRRGCALLLFEVVMWKRYRSSSSLEEVNVSACELLSSWSPSGANSSLWQLTSGPVDYALDGFI